MLNLRTFGRLVFFVLPLLGIASMPVKSATLDVSNGQLFGAFGVEIDGSYYDVEFLDGSCAQNFPPCNSVSNFDFQTFEDAAAASQALLDQVLLDTALGNFDSDPELVNGCGDVTNCNVQSPYSTLFGLVTSAAAFNLSPDQSQPDRVVNASSTPNLVWPSETWAKWSPGLPPVPIPAAVWLFGTALLGLIGFSSRRK